MSEAKSQLSKLVAKVVEDGDVVVIAKAGKPLVDLVPHQARPPRKPGGFDIVMDNFAAADPDIATLFEGS